METTLPASQPAHIPPPDERKITGQAMHVDVNGLEKELKDRIEGEVRFDPGSRALYATDSSNYRQIPIGVVLPRTEKDILETVALCRRYGAPVLSRGGGTSLAGQGCNVAVIMDQSKYYNRLLTTDVPNRRVRVQTGIVLDHMKDQLLPLGLTFGPDPSTHNHCTIGGMLGNNSCGVHSVMSANAGYGARMSDNMESMAILTYDGIRMEVGPTTDEEYDRILAEGGRKADIYRRLRSLRDRYAALIRQRFPDIPRRVSGFNLTALLPENGFNVAAALVGTESTCVTILEATLKLLPEPKARSLVVLGYPSLYDAGRDVMDILSFRPIGLEGLDEMLLKYMRKKGYHTEDISLLPDGKAWLLVEFGGDSQEDTDRQARTLMDKLRQVEAPPTASLFDDKEQADKLWEVRKSGLGATAWVPGEPITEEGWEDSAVPPERIGEYLRDLRKLFNKYGWNPSLYGHFGQGCVHCRVPFDMLTAEGLRRYRKFTVEAAELVVAYGGSISGEHGDGQSKADLLEIMYGKELVEAFREFKEIWDPEYRMNPGKVVQPYGQLANMRTGIAYSPKEPQTHFEYPDEEHSFSRAMLRCVGVGECRRTSGGTMCPSYRVTKEEKDSTRGRARMLFEMQMGDVAHGWKDRHVRESLDLCLSCKGCKGDCPVNVDMATYKAEFLSHYYKGRIRRPSAFAFGWIDRWSRLASAMPGIANFFTQSGLTAPLIKALAGIAPQRKLPSFARRTFRDWWKKEHITRDGSRGKVILWPDTFNNYFLPETLIAGVQALEACGFEVSIPSTHLCCGRPLYDYGMLVRAKKLLHTILSALRDDIRQGVPVVGLEPSCTAVFRDELCNLFPADMDAMRLKTQTFTLAELLEKKAADLIIPTLPGGALLHGHCHHKAIMTMSADERLMKRIGLDYELLDAGCCGMAGSFGYEKGRRYEVSVGAGELALLPRVRSTKEDTLIITDGFSCREQIRQLTGRKALHTAEVLAKAWGVGRPDLPVTHSK